MFCHKCGMKIKPKTSICPNCNRPVDENEFCGGFWDLLEGEEKPQKNRKESGENQESNQESNRSEHAETCVASVKENEVGNGSAVLFQLSKKTAIAAAAVLGILVLFSGVQTVRIGRIRGERDLIAQEKAELEESYAQEKAELERKLEIMEALAFPDLFHRKHPLQGDENAAPNTGNTEEAENTASSENADNAESAEEIADTESTEAASAEEPAEGTTNT